MHSNRPCAVYRFFAADWSLLYVGRAYNPFSRFGLHSGEKSWMGEVSTMTVVWFATSGEAVKAEADAIRAEAPRYNIQRPTGVDPKRIVTGNGPELVVAWIKANGLRAFDFDRALRLPYGVGPNLRAGRRVPKADIAAAIEELTSGAVPASSWGVAP